MIITRKFTMALDRRGVAPVVDAVQDDSHTRAVAITLTNEGRPWKIPDGTTAAVRFKKPDGKSGLYDTLPDNNAAYSIDGNVVTVTLAPEVLTAEGHVDAAVALYNGNDVLGTFPFIVNVAPNPAAGRTVSNNYYYLQTWDDVNEANAFLSGRVDGLGQAVYTGFRQVNEAVNGLHARVSILEQNPGGGGGGTGGSGGTGGVAVEIDPTVPAWAKQPNKPTYTASEVGARPDTWTPTAQEVGALPNSYTPPNQTAEQVGADPKGTAAGAVSDHNTNTASHEDIRLLIEGLATRLNALANSTDTDLDQMAELVAYIKNNKNLIDGITTSKVSVADIVNNLTTNVANKPLSAAQGVALKALIEAITVPTKLSQLTNDKGYLTEHQDISGKLDASALPTAINTALAQAKASGEFDGEDGQRGAGLLSVTTAPSSYTTAVGGITPKYRMAISTIKTQAGVTEVLLGDTVRYSYYHYPIDYLDASYAYFTERVSIRGATGAAGTTPVKGVDYFDGTDGNDGYTPVRGVDYWTPDDIAAIDADIAKELAKRAQLRPEPAESLEWLEENGDQSKIYVLPDGNLCMWVLTEKEVSTGGGYTNALDGVTKNINQRWSHSGKKLAAADGYMTATIPVKADQKVYVNLPRVAFLGNYPRVHYLDASNNYVTTVDRLTANAQILTTKDGVTSWTVGYEMTTAGDTSTHGRLAKADTITQMVIVLNVYDGIRNSESATPTLGSITEDDVKDIIISVGNPIAEGGTEIVKEYAWVETGLNITPADYEPRIIILEEQTAQNTADINALKKGAVDTGGVDALTWIRNWDNPIYDRVPVFQLTEENPAVTAAEKTVAAVYAKYDALVSANARYITRTNMGMCSDGITPVYRYDFREPEPHHQSGMQWSETKPTIIIVSGIHGEMGGIYSLYYALKEITENPELDDLRRNVHFVVVPVMNPYCMIGPYNQTYGVQNANGVEIHRNFEVGFKYPGESGYIEPGNRSHGGTEPLSEVESQYIDNLFKQYPDAALFMTCHSAQRDTRWGTGFIWASTATEYTCNLGYRLVDKMSKAWHKKYGTTWEEGCVRENNFVLANPTTYPNGVKLEEGDYRAGHAHVSSTNGTETRQATKYGIQGANVEVLDTFWVLSSTGLDSKLTTHGAEVYINYLLMYMGCYDHKDKKQYYIQ